MPHNVTAAFIKQFEAEVHQAYSEAGEKLAGVVRTKTGVVGAAVQFPVYGKGAATARGASGSKIQTMGVGASSVNAELKGYVAAEFSDVFDEAALNFDDRQELAKAIGAGIRRSEDTVIINAMRAAAGATVVSGTESVQGDVTGITGIGDGTAVLTVDNIRAAKRKLDDAGVPSNERFFVTSPAGIDAMLASEKVTSLDYANVKALVNGEMDTFLGFKFIMLADCSALGAGGNVVKTGLPFTAAGSKRASFAFHRAAMGYGNAIDKTTYADWMPEYASFLIQSHLKCGAVAIDPAGVVAVLHKEV